MAMEIVGKSWENHRENHGEMMIFRRRKFRDTLRGTQNLQTKCIKMASKFDIFLGQIGRVDFGDVTKFGGNSWKYK